MFKLLSRSILPALLCFSFPVATNAEPWADALIAFDQQRFSESVALMTPLAEAGHVQAQDKLSHIYYFGDGVPVDFEAALAWTRRALEQNSPIAQYNLADHYSKGILVEKDEREAVKWLRLAADQDFPPAMYNLALRLQGGIGVEKSDPQEARHLLERAAFLGFPAAHRKLGGDILLEYESSFRGWELALPHFEKAAEGRDRLAMMLMGYAYVGQAGITDFHKAALFFVAATDHGCLDGLNWISVTTGADPEVEAAVRAEYEDWKSRHPHPRPHNHDEDAELCITTGTEQSV